MTRLVTGPDKLLAKKMNVELVVTSLIHLEREPRSVHI